MLKLNGNKISRNTFLMISQTTVFPISEKGIVKNDELMETTTNHNDNSCPRPKWHMVSCSSEAFKEVSQIGSGSSDTSN